ncbi:hypothetical protein P43SY_012020 [Pythium insidiosum]|uniref:Probable pectate lyase F n=1 Tax=Pythium insidiosum TaxID=114742 RepID=A0AAD5Q134_PYTIN|nr:hypothetical protein P43SY_012020 [Pythium insidiosum]
MFANINVQSLVLLLSLAVSAHAAPMPSGAWPKSQGLERFDAPRVVKAGETFDGGMKTYERSNVVCQGQKESGAKDAVFIVEPGATLKNVIIGKNQMEGVHCDRHDCTIENVWWDDVCEDALTIKGGSASSLARVIGGGARHADDKIVQHNGAGKVSIDGFYAHTFGKLYRSCGTCGEVKREVEVTNVLAVEPKSSVVTVNSNFGDRAVLRNVVVESSKSKVTVCGKTKGGKGGEPTKDGDGPDGTVCVYGPNDVKVNGGRSDAAAGDSDSNGKDASKATKAPKKSKKKEDRSLDFSELELQQQEAHDDDARRRSLRA